MAEDEAEIDRAPVAFNLLFADLVERLLTLADNPAKSSDYIAKELRALLGAKTVAVLSHHETPAFHGHQLRSVFPERRRALADSAEIKEIAELSHAYSDARLFEAGTYSREAEILAGLGLSSALVLPLAYGSRRVGVIVLLELLDLRTLGKAVDTLERLSGILALVLRNADLYAHLEDEVAQRTAMLERRRLELEALLREVHHRVKNNLQIVLSLLYLKSSTTENEEARTLLEDSQGRIFAMSLVHEEIYRSGDFTGIDLADYAPRIADRLLDAACPQVERVYRTEKLRLDLGIAIPCGLIVSELITNSVKHAFCARGGGRLTISTGMRGSEAFIEVSDDGPGFSQSAESGDEKGIGLSIVRGLVDQIHGRMETGSGPGATVALFFPALLG